jgi:hypothetical protein
VPEWVVVVVVAWVVVGNPHYIPLEHIMKTLSTITILLVSASLAGSAFARGPGSGMGSGQGQMAGSGQKYGQGNSQSQGTQMRKQTRDSASTPTGQPIQQRDRIHTPGTVVPPATATN